MRDFEILSKKEKNEFCKYWKMYGNLRREKHYSHRIMLQLPTLQKEQKYTEFKQKGNIFHYYNKLLQAEENK